MIRAVCELVALSRMKFIVNEKRSFSCVLQSDARSSCCYEDDGRHSASGRGHASFSTFLVAYCTICISQS